jgi:hypothetical protein
VSNVSRNDGALRSLHISQQSTSLSGPHHHRADGWLLAPNKATQPQVTSCPQDDFEEFETPDDIYEPILEQLENVADTSVRH